MILLEGGNFDGLVYLLFAIMLGPPVLLILIGFLIKKKDSYSAKVFFVLAGLYLVIGLGFCGSMMI